jgi:predicted CopG family antitoxin
MSNACHTRPTRISLGACPIGYGIVQCPYAHRLTSKNISITEEAYEALQREKASGESFTEAILRLTRERGKLSDCFGSWKTTDDEQEAIRVELKRGWRRAQERISSEVP